MFIFLLQLPNRTEDLLRFPLYSVSNVHYKHHSHHQEADKTQVTKWAGLYKISERVMETKELSVLKIKKKELACSRNKVLPW